jgi:hypothetical protein
MEKPYKYKILPVSHWILEEVNNTPPSKGTLRYGLKIFPSYSKCSQLTPYLSQ